MMSLRGDVHPWVREFQDRGGWGLQAFALPEDTAPAASILAAGRLADQVGLDGFYIGDHPAYAPDAWLHLGVLAVQTARVRLGSVVLCAGYRPPVINARLAADLDNLSRGRVVLGLGHGWNATEFAQLGLPFPPVPERQAALEEAIQIIRGVLSSEPFTFHGVHHHVDAEQVTPPPVQEGGLPLLLAGAGEKRALRLVARYADASNFGAGHSTGLLRMPEEIGRRNAVLDRYCAEEGRDPRSVLRSHFTSWLMIGPTEAAARVKLDRYYPHGLNEEQRYSRVVGSPEQVAGYYQSLVDVGMEYFVVQILDARDLETIELLAREVVPRVQPRRRA
jgi:alkanesulfonate monooxygenase SsuD/methylene tetrahydromethanopterin reductase-like flavin-dependent oxidoreductase (luciferase family)